jgi:hypothetical protein
MGYLPLCAVCGLPVRYPMVIEVLIPDTHGGTEVDADRKACWVQENCVLIHPGECYKTAVTDAGDWCAHVPLSSRGCRKDTGLAGGDGCSPWAGSMTKHESF